MERAAGDDSSIQSDDRNDRHQSIVAELASLIEHVQASTKRLEAALAGEMTLGNQEVAANVFVLDDVTPYYVKASAVLNSCVAGLNVALNCLLDAKPSNDVANGSRETTAV